MEIALGGIVALQKLRCYNGVMNMNSIHSLSDAQLIQDVEQAAVCERGATVRMIALLSELDARRLYLDQGYSSLFVYCTKHLRLSEHAAYGRIEAARVARRFPVILDKLTDGSMTLTTVCLLSNHLTGENHAQLLDAARHKTRREVEEQVAALHPMPAVPSSVRKLPQPSAVASALEDLNAKELTTSAVRSVIAPTISIGAKAAPIHAPAPPIVRPLAPERYSVQFSIGSETHAKLRRLQDLLRHSIPNGDVAQIVDHALTLLLRRVEAQKIARANRPRDPGPITVTGRHVPASIKRTVRARDRGQCAFVGTAGRCEERGFLEFHHVMPFVEGGPTTADNLELRCRAHNGYETAKHFRRL